MKKLLGKLPWIITVSSLLLNIVTIFHFNTVMKSFKNIDADYRYPSIRLSIHYTQSDGTRKEMIVYDDDIDVGSEVINAKLTSIIYEYRSMYMFCSCHSPDITITEKQDGAWIVISWQGIIKMTFLNYE